MHWKTVLPFALTLVVIAAVLFVVSNAGADESGFERAGAHIAGDPSSISVRVSQLGWPERAPNVYLGNAGDPALASFARPDGPLLLVPAGQTRIHYGVYEEIVRVQPNGVIAVGGVHPNVLEEARLSPAALKAKWDREDARSCSHPFGCPYEGTIAQRVARCESHENPNAKNPRSTASGLFQALNSTWSSVTGLAPPARAHPTQTQIDFFWKLWADGSGARHWNASRSCWGKYWEG